MMKAVTQLLAAVVLAGAIASPGTLRADSDRPPAEIVGPTFIPELTGLVARVAPATVFVLARDAFDQVLQGTGVVVRADGWIATSYELVAWTDHFEVQVTLDGRLTALPARLVRVYPELNLALLWVPAGALPTLDVASDDAIRSGAALVALGYPSYNQLERGLRIIRGRLSLPLVLEGPDDTRTFWADLLYLGGMAGSPVCTVDGDLVGLIVGPLPDDNQTTRVLAIGSVRARVEAVAASYITPVGSVWLP